MREEEDTNIYCPRCGLGEDLLKRDRRVSCPLCYTVFSPLIETLLSGRELPVDNRSGRAVDELLH